MNRAVPTDELEPVVAELVQKLARRSPSGLARMKRMVDVETDMSWEHAARYELVQAEALLASGVPDEGWPRSWSAASRGSGPIGDLRASPMTT